MTYVDSFELAGRKIRVAFRELPGDHEFILDNYLTTDALGGGGANNYQPGSAKVATIVSAVRKLEMDGVEIPLSSQRKKIPRIDDPDTGETLMNALLKRIVKQEDWLLEAPYNRVFAQYAPEDPDEQDDPFAAFDGEGNSEEKEPRVTELKPAENPTEPPAQGKTPTTRAGSSSSSSS
jgi:hypothetical protein